jgi:hypothetical protein
MGLIVSVLIFLCSGLFHPVHISLSTIDIDPETSEINVSIKLFADDFECMVNQKYNTKLKLMEQVDPGQDIYFINRYIDSSFVLSVNGKEIAGLDYLRNEMNEGAIWLYYRHECGTRIESVSLINSLMCELFQDQTNLVIITVKEEQNGYRLNNKNRELSVRV